MQYGASVSFQSFTDVPLGGTLRGVAVQGPFNAVMEAVSKIILKLKSHRPVNKENEVHLADGRVMLKWIVPQSVCGVLIGRGGEGIKHINKHSGAWVKVAHAQEYASAPDAAAERCVYVSIAIAVVVDNSICHDLVDVLVDVILRAYMMTMV